MAAAAAALVVFAPQPASAWENDLGEVTLYESGGLSERTLAALDTIADVLGVEPTVMQSGTIRMISVYRDGEPVQEFADGFGVPMSFTALDPVGARPLVGDFLSDSLADGVVMSEASASLRGAQPGDRVTLQGWDGTFQEVRLSAVLPDDLLAWNELVFGIDLATRLGIDRPARAVMWDVNTTVVDLLTRSVLGDAPVRVRGPGSERPPFVDWVLPLVMVKQRFGEFAFRETGTDRIETDDEWYEANIRTIDHPLLGRFACHRSVIPYIEGAVAELETTGLVGEVDVADFQQAGGCYNPRLARGGDLDRGFAISRHSWGIAIDFNPSSNQFGAEPTLSEDFGNVWRAWGFAWGAGWGVGDPMHFEWHAEPTDDRRFTCAQRLAVTAAVREPGDVVSVCP
ncbi:MAG: M15 family metallopeptidase [Acidimicrobiia bacterium]|nr:M15 family metallopeptidase [Acidimicrobiia bacterium]